MSQVCCLTLPLGLLDRFLDGQPDHRVGLGAFDGIHRTGTPATRIVVLSAVDDGGSRQPALETGADLCLVKGVVPWDMAKQLEELVGAGGPAAAK